MQLAMNASHAPRRNGKVACCAFSKHKASISRGATKAGVAYIDARKVTATNAHFGFNDWLLTLQLTDLSAVPKGALGEAHCCEFC